MTGKAREYNNTVTTKVVALLLCLLLIAMVMDFCSPFAKGRRSERRRKKEEGRTNIRRHKKEEKKRRQQRKLVEMFTWFFHTFLFHKEKMTWQVLIGSRGIFTIWDLCIGVCVLKGTNGCFYFPLFDVSDLFEVLSFSLFHSFTKTL